ncbi:MAG: asparagine synthase (glutamine-hydrolyzing) [Colwellia sp.]
MCGLVGLIVKKDSFLKFPVQQALEDAIQIQVHRGPDRQAQYYDEKQGVGLAHARLSIQDLSESGDQPMHSHCDRYTIVFNGEIYNFLELRNELVAKGISFIGSSDTEVLLSCIQLFGIKKTLHKLIGMYAFAIYDRMDNTLTICRDKVGEKPLYYFKSEKGLFFSSDLAGIREVVNTEFKICKTALSLYFHHQYIPAPHSIYEGVKKLSAAEMVVFNVTTLESISTRYWGNKSSNPNEGGNAADLKQTLKSLIIDSVKKQFIADVDVGIFLSGGVDSSLIAAIAKKELGKDIQTFTIGFSEKEFDEAPAAKAIADYLGLESNISYVDAEGLLDVIDKIPNVYTEPFSDTSLLPTFLISAEASKKVKVCLTGDGGDELFAGYSRYILASQLYSKTKYIPLRLRAWIATASKVLANVNVHMISIRNLQRKLFQLSRVLDYKDQHDLYSKILSPYASEIKGILKNSQPMSALDRVKLPLDANIDFIEYMMMMDKLTYLPENNLVKVDRASMFHSLEVRAPLLEHLIVSFSDRVPMCMKTNGKEGKLILKELQREYLPESILDSRKRGFSVPIGEWLRGPLKGWAESLLNSNNKMVNEHIDLSYLKQIFESHCKGKQDWYNILWTSLNFINWCHRHSES